MHCSTGEVCCCKYHQNCKLRRLNSVDRVREVLSELNNGVRVEAQRSGIETKGGTVEQYKNVNISSRAIRALHNFPKAARIFSGVIGSSRMRTPTAL